MEKWRSREKVLRARAQGCRVPVAYANLVGGQDELVFDGHSMVLDGRGEVVACGRQFEEDLLLVDVEIFGLDEKEEGKERLVVSRRRAEPLSVEAEVYRALMLGLRDYVRKNGFNRVVVGLSGGIDSALTATVAADALGPENVELVFMPTRYSSEESLRDSRRVAENLRAHFSVIPIQEVFEHYLGLLAESFAGKPPDETEENLQARIRGNILMALSNKHGWLVLATGNKSEMSVGYATLYGDMVGGFAVLKDVPKTLVYRLAEYRNRQAGYDLIPENILRKAPSAELRENQKDTDSLPPYEVLDPIIEAYVVHDLASDQIVELGYDPRTVARVIRMIDRSEYKRRQAPVGIKITPRAFGKDRRMPITNRFRG